MAAVLVSCGSDASGTAGTTAPTERASTSTTAVQSTGATDIGPSCARTTASAEQTVTFTFTHTDDEQGVGSEAGSRFAHVKGVAIVTPAENTTSLSVTISVLDGPTIATIDDMAPGSTCGIDHDFAPGDYFVRSSDGNGTQFTSFPDR